MSFLCGYPTINKSELYYGLQKGNQAFKVSVAVVFQSFQVSDTPLLDILLKISSILPRFLMPTAIAAGEYYSNQSISD